MALPWAPERAAPPRLLGPDQHGPRPRGGEWLIEVLKRSGLRGKGGAAFPVWRKWAGLAESSGGRAIVVVNGSEGEPLSAKDRTLLRERPHLVLDGAALAAETIGAGEVVLYVSRSEPALAAAIRERRRGRLGEPSFTIVRTEHTYVAGESSAVAQRLSGAPALPRFTPPHVSERGVFGRPTLVQNTETLAHVALVARYGTAPPTTLMTLAGGVRSPGVYEVDLDLRIGDVLRMAGGVASEPAGALVGGYFGAWLPGEGLESASLAELHLGCGVLAVLPAGACGIVESARVLEYLAGESAGQCGPCVYGLRALSDTARRLAASQASPDDVVRLRRWAALVKGRGACHHPDGAAGQLESALAAFEDHVAEHLAGRRCAGLDAHGFPQPPKGRRR